VSSATCRGHRHGDYTTYLSSLDPYLILDALAHSLPGRPGPATRLPAASYRRCPPPCPWMRSMVVVLVLCPRPCPRPRDNDVSNGRDQPSLLPAELAGLSRSLCLCGLEPASFWCACIQPVTLAAVAVRGVAVAARPAPPRMPARTRPRSACAVRQPAPPRDPLSRAAAAATAATAAAAARGCPPFARRRSSPSSLLRLASLSRFSQSAHARVIIFHRASAKKCRMRIHTTERRTRARRRRRTARSGRRPGASLSWS